MTSWFRKPQQKAAAPASTNSPAVAVASAPARVSEPSSSRPSDACQIALAAFHQDSKEPSRPACFVAACLGDKNLLVLCAVSKRLRLVFSADVLWRPRAIARWSELSMATRIKDDPFPAWKSTYQRKAAVRDTTLSDLMDDREFRHCDFYSCSKGHLYMIGECRMPMVMSKCPTCGERIGGQHHTMLSHNKRVGAVQSSAMRDKKISLSQLGSAYENKTNKWSNTWSWAQHLADLEERGLDLESACSVCEERPVTCLLLPCRHARMCTPCTDAIRLRGNKCPDCDARIEKVLVRGAGTGAGAGAGSAATTASAAPRGR